MKILFKVILIVLTALAVQARAATCTSNGSGDWKDNVWASSGSCNSGSAGPSAGSDVVIANGTNVKVDSTPPTVANITINSGGTLSGNGGNTLTLTGNFTNNGTFTANGGTVAFAGTNQTITGNVTFANLTLGVGSVLTLAGNVTVTGTLTGTVTLADTCPTNYTLTLANGTVKNSCGGGGGGCNSLLPAFPAGGAPVASGATMALDTGVKVNTTAVTLTTGSNSILNPATTTSWSSAGTALAAPPSPIPNSTTLTTVGASGLSAGSYGDVRVTSGVGVFSGGNYYINELYVAPGATAQLAPGDYYVNKFTVGNSNTNTGGVITLSGAGLVRIFVNTNAKNDAVRYGGDSGIWDGSRINVGGNPANLQILLYPTVTYFEIGQGAQLTGFVVQPAYAGTGANAAIDVHDNVVLTGGVYTAGSLKIKQNVMFLYTAQVASALAALSQCSAVPVAEYRMDEPSWNGTLGEVKDASSHAQHGTAMLGATPALAKVCNGANLSGQYINVPDTPLLNVTSALTVTAWLKPARWAGAPGKDNLMSFLSKDINYEAHINTQGKVNWWWGNGEFNSTGTVPIGVWTHVTLVYQSGKQTIYLNGVASGTATFTGALPTTPLPFQIGDDQLFGGGTRRFDGMIDEVKIFNVAMSAAQVAAGVSNENNGKNWDGSARVCPVYGPHHLEISDAGNGVGLTCTPSTLTIKACADAACTTPYTNGFSGTLTATGVVTANWGGGTPDFVIPAGSSSVTKTLQLTAANADVATTLGASSTASNPATCTFASCSYTAYNAGFLFDVPHHVAGVAQTVSVRSVKKADNSGACVPGLANVTRTVQVSCSYTNPVAGTLPVQVNTRYLNPGNSASAVCAASSPVSLTFDAAGVASATVIYPDAGDMGLNMTYTGAGASGDAGLVMQGADAFVAVPASLVFSGVPVSPLVAGKPFNVTVTAMNGATPIAATPNFGHETAPAVVTLGSTNPQPGLGNASAINVGLSGFAAGAASTNLTWNEVGTIDLTANHVNYLGSSLSATGTLVGAGRFQPAYFDVSVTPGCGTFTYAGSVTPAKPGQPLVVTVKAKRFGADATDATNTANYAGSHAFATTLSNAGSLVGLSGNTIATTGFVNGIGTAPVTYAGAIEKIAPLTLTLRALDGDTPAVSSAGHAEGSALLRSGRLALQNAYGSELLALPLALEAQYWAGSFYTTNTADNCTALPINSIVMSGYTGGLAACETQLTPTGTVTLAGGKLAGLKLTKPGAGNQGSVNLAVNVSATAAGNTCVGATESPATAANIPWFGTNLGSRATFGIYKSPLIYRRENY